MTDYDNGLPPEGTDISSSGVNGALIVTSGHNGTVAESVNSLLVATAAQEGTGYPNAFAALFAGEEAGANYGMLL